MATLVEQEPHAHVDEEDSGGQEEREREERLKRIEQELVQSLNSEDKIRQERKRLASVCTFRMCDS